MIKKWRSLLPGRVDLSVVDVSGFCDATSVQLVAWTHEREERKGTLKRPARVSVLKEEADTGGSSRTVTTKNNEMRVSFLQETRKAVTRYSCRQHRCKTICWYPYGTPDTQTVKILSSKSFYENLILNPDAIFSEEIKITVLNQKNSWSSCSLKLCLYYFFWFWIED